MAKLGISTGITPNDGTGDSLLLGAIKINSNFSDIYTYFGDGTNLTSIGGTWRNTSVGIHTLKNVGIGTTNPTSALTVTGNGTFTGVVTATTFVGNVTGTATTATNAQGLTGTPNLNVGIVTASRLNVGTSGTVIATTSGGLVGIGTTNPRFILEVGVVGASGTTLFVNGDARVTGIVTIGPASITLNGITNTVNIGTGITLNGSTGIISATAIVLGGTTLTGAAVTFITAGSGISVNQGTGNVTITATGGGGSSQFVTTAAGIHTLSNVGIGTTNPTQKLTVSGNAVITGITTHLDKISIRTSLVSNEYASLSNSGKLVLGDGTSTVAGLDIINNASGVGEVFSITTPATYQYGKKVVIDLTGRILLGGYLDSSHSNALTVIDTQGNISLSGYVSAGGTIGASGLTAGTVQISSGIVTATSGIVTYYGDASYTASGRWTLGANGSTDYTFTGIGFTQTTNDPVLYLARGRVYEFVNNSGGSHPFQIRVSDGGSAYSNGVTGNGSTTGVIRFEIPFSAPNTLYYQCTAHSGMGNTISVYPNTI